MVILGLSSRRRLGRRRRHDELQLPAPQADVDRSRRQLERDLLRRRGQGDWTIASPNLAATFHRPLRMTVAGLWLVGVGFAGFTAPRAWQQTGVTSALPFVAVVFGLSLLAVAVLRADRVALLVSAIGLGAQILGVIGSAWELAQGVHSYKSRELRDLGVDPELGVALNLAYSAVASVDFAWLMARWFKNRSRPDA